MADNRLILVLDEGTSSTRAILYALDGTVAGQCAEPLTQHYPAPGLVEHDAIEIWDKTLACARRVIADANGAERVAAIGITNQRETVVAWDRASGAPLHRAIVWQDRRTADRCEALRAAGHEAAIQRATGLQLDPYFSGTKMAWLARQPEVTAACERLALGTIDSWLAWKLTGDHVTDVTNASRTMLFDLDGNNWDDRLVELLDVPRGALPRIVPTVGAIGKSDPKWFGVEIPLTAMVGDQQSATVGQGCLGRGQTKLTLGTGAFALTSLGEARPDNPGRLLGTVLIDDGARRQYAIEGSIFVAGSLVKWLRDDLGLLDTADESEALARSVTDSGGVTMLPALAGLGAPYWRPAAKAVFAGMSFATTRAHLVRAALEAISHQAVDLAKASADAGAPWAELHVDGGMAANDWLVQDLADMLGLPVSRPVDVETTARGAAMLAAAVGAGLFGSIDEAKTMLPLLDRFEPATNEAARDRRLEAWNRLIAAI